MSGQRTSITLAITILLAACGGGGSIDSDASDGGVEDPCAAEVPGTVCGVAGTGELGFNHDGKPPLETDFFLVSRSWRGPDGLLYFADFNNWRMRVLGEDGLIHTIAGNGVHAGGFTGDPAIESPLENLNDFVFLPDGRLAMVFFEDPRVLIIDGEGILHSIAGTGAMGTVGDEGDGGDPLQASFMELRGIAVGPDGAIYLSDAKANRVRVIRDNIITTVAGNGADTYDGDGGPATDAGLKFPTAVTVDAEGDLYIADSLHNVIRRVTPDGIIETVAGTGEEGFSGDGGPATEARLNQPTGIAVDADGTMYIADRSNFRVRRVTPDGIISTIAGTDEGYSGDGGPATEAQFGYLGRLNFDGRSLLVADQSNGCIRRIYLSR
ncbi:MAG TPA: hypothetical protein VFG83_04415 [Kofleriaceae bacterium]|nr:hypothetical protein [Kofleriaceae bacterium]